MLSLGLFVQMLITKYSKYIAIRPLTDGTYIHLQNSLQTAVTAKRLDIEIV